MPMTVSKTREMLVDVARQLSSAFVLHILIKTVRKSTGKNNNYQKHTYILSKQTFIIEI